MELLVKEPYVRVFVPTADTQGFLNRFVTAFGGKIDFQFTHEPSESTVYAVSTALGRYSVTSTDKEQPEFIAKTRAVYIVKNIDDVLAVAVKNGMEIGQEKSPVPIGFQARLKVSEGNYLELAEWNDAHIAQLRAAGFEF